MGELPQNTIFASPATVKDLLCLTMNPQLVFIEQVPFTPTETQTIVGYRETYTSNTDPKASYAPEDGIIEENVEGVEVTLGSPIGFNTRPRHSEVSFNRSEMNKPNFDKLERKKYNSLVWGIAKQVDSSLVTTLTGNAGSATTRYDAGTNGVWDGNTADPLDDIALIAQDIGTNAGYELKAIYVHTENFYEMRRLLDSNDLDMDYARGRVERESFYTKHMRIKDPAVDVYGIDTGLGLSHGQILGIGAFQGEPCVTNYAYSDPTFGSIESLGVTDKGEVVPDLPLNVNTYWSTNNKEYHVEAWFDTAPFVERPYGIFYKSSGI